jgi:hypothetical protein
MTSSNSTGAPRASVLASLLGQLSAKDQPFARDLIRAATSRGASDKQAYWIERLIERATSPQPSVEDRTSEVGSFAKVYALFATARQHLKFPKIRLQLPNGLPVTLAISGDKSAHPNTINVTDGGPYGSNKWYGRVAADGAWTAGRSFPELSAVAELLKELGEAPAETASKYGRLTGYCCFCNTPLTDEKSTAVGYGPVCAKHYGLSAEYKAAKPLFTALVAQEAA